MQTVYLDKRDRIRSWWTAPRIAAAVAASLAILFLPLWRQTVTARFLLEPVRMALVRTTVPGEVNDVFVTEGQWVQAGEPLLRMTSTDLESLSAGSGEQLALTGVERVQAQLSHGDLGATNQQHLRAGAEQSITAEESGRLIPRAPIPGVITTARLGDLMGSYLDAGTLLTGIADTSQMRARIFVHEFEAGRVHPGQHVSLLPDGAFASLGGAVDHVQVAPNDLPPAVESIRQITGGARLQYYIADAIVPNSGLLRSGMTGTAKIVIRKTSLAGILARELRDFVDRKLW
jgi:multidrug efflux pump subunit AcrA (membrane-fusion protein)